MYYYKVESSHWKNTLEFQSEIKLDVGQCFRIVEHDGTHHYPTRFKVIAVEETPEYNGNLVTIKSVNLDVEPF